MRRSKVNQPEKIKSILGGLYTIMKSKIPKILSVALALVLVLSFSLVMAVPAAAATAVTITSVTPDSRVAAEHATYTIIMTTATGLVNGTDTISIIFPTGMIPSATAAAPDDVKINTVALDSITTADYLVSGQRLTLTVPTTGTFNAGTVTVVIGDGGGNTEVTNPSAGSYTLQVYTSKDTTAVTSGAIIIGDSVTCKLDPPTVALDNYEVGIAADYTIGLGQDDGVTLAADTDTITITFPDEVTVPTGISDRNYVSIATHPLDSTDDYSAVGQVVTLTVPEDVEDDTFNVVFMAEANIINPETAGATGTYNTFTALTSLEPIESAVGDYDEGITAGDITKAVFSVFPVPAEYNVATAITIETQDQYGNASVVSGSKTWVLTTTNTDPGVFDPATVVLTSASSSTFDYKDTVSGATVTAYESPTEGWADATGTFTINPQVALYHGDEPVANFTTIQTAIDAAVTGDTINVGAGTYNPFTVENFTGPLTIQSDPVGAATITSSGATISEPLVEVSTSSSVTIKGFMIDGKSKFSGYGTSAISVNACTGTIIITENIIQNLLRGDSTSNLNDCGTGIYALNSSVTITDNSITSYHGNGIRIRQNSGTVTATITGNTIQGCGLNEYYSGDAIRTDGAVTAAISDNELSNNKYAEDAYDPVKDDWSASAGLSVHEDSVITATNNSIHDSDFGIHVKGVASGTLPVLSASYNDIYDNGQGFFYEKNTGDTTGEFDSLDITHNWWGSLTGPNTPANPSGTANAVTADVAFTKVSTADIAYSPWLSTGQASVVASGKSQYATAVKMSSCATFLGSTYSGGWNTFSTPIWLDGSADTWGEATALVTLDYVTAYGWDGTNWTTVVASTPLTPLDAVFVQLKTEAQSIPILYSTQLLVAPTKTMHAAAGSYTGWELVGPARLPDPGTMTKTTEFLSIADNYSQAINPITGNVLNCTNEIVVGAGYWVFMTSDATLAGFTVTPVPFVAVQ